MEAQTGDRIAFSVTVRGASHIKAGTPCQDASAHFVSDNKELLIAIVADGHGSKTYVRSDVGSRLAVEIAMENVKGFVENTPATLFKGRKAAVTSRPDMDDFCRLSQKDEKSGGKLSETDRELLTQYQDYRRQTAGIERQDEAVYMLFCRIYSQWLDAIHKDSEENPFSDYEKKCLEGRDIVKAYGSTLICFVRTPDYWLAFHIGDGKMVACDIDRNWSEPVPWDCRCFLNITTSLCGENAVSDFRYAFDGTGVFPEVVVMGSDGLDDSWGNMERLCNFYELMLKNFMQMDESESVEELRNFLPKLSAMASQDDMSVAGIICMDSLPDILSSRKDDHTDSSPIVDNPDSDKSEDVEEYEISDSSDSKDKNVEIPVDSDAERSKEKNETIG